jgi:hypothetical protein
MRGSINFKGSAVCAPSGARGPGVRQEQTEKQNSERVPSPLLLAAMGADDGAAAWVEDTCRALSTAELFVQPDMGDGRFAEASSVLRTLLSWVLESWPDSQQVRDEVQPYYKKVLGLVLPSLVVAALLLLCLLPLCVSRRCVRP